MTALGVTSEIYLDGLGWVDNTDDVKLATKVTITGGRSNEGGQVAPSNCSLTLVDPDGRYVLDNPLGQYYGLIGRNTPQRVAVLLVRDTFSRTVAAGMGNTDSGQTWVLTGSGGTVANANWAVGGGVCTMSQPTVSGNRQAVLKTSTLIRDVDVQCDVTLPVSNVLGGDLEPGNLIVRQNPVTDEHYLCRVVVTAAEQVTVTWRHSSAGQLATPVTVAGLTHSGQTLRVRAQAEGNTLRAKVWAAASPEPYDWTITVHDERIVTAGAVGVRNGVASANTNPLPIVFTIDNFLMRSMRFAGEISAWSPRWDLSGNDATVEVDASGLLRRLGQGQPQLKSPLYRGITTAARSSLQAYWPCEDSNGSTSIASALGGPSMVVYGSPRFATNDDFVCSQPLPEMNGSAWFGDVPAYEGTGVVQLRFLMRVPASGSVDDRIIARMGIGGTASLWELVYMTGGGLKLKAYNPSGTPILDTGTVGFNVNGKLLRVSVELDQNGADVDWRMSVLEVGSTVGGFTSGTLAGVLVDRCLQVQICPQQAMTDVVIGHVSLESELTSLFTLDDELAAHTGETAGRRAIRLAAEEAQPLSYVGNPDNTQRMGPQGIGTFLGLLQSCAKAERGTLGEARGHNELVFRSRASLYNAAAVATLNLSAGQVSNAPEQAPDDQLTVNDFVAKRAGGSSYRVIRETGPMSVLPPQQGGIGRYDSSDEFDVEHDAQLPQLAGAAVNEGTQRRGRYPRISVRLHHPTIASSYQLHGSLLSVGLDDRVVMVNNTRIHVYDDIEQITRGWTESIGHVVGDVEHDITFNCSPAAPYNVVKLDDTVLGKLDSSSSTLDRALGAGVTSAWVVSQREKWTTAPAQMPIPLAIGGERVTATAIGSATPALVSVGTAAHADNAPVTPGLPAGLAAGQLLLLFAAGRASGSLEPNIPAGYSLLLDASNMRLMGKYAEAGEVAPQVTFTASVAGSTCSAQLAAFTNTSLQIAVPGVTQLNGSAQNIAYPAAQVAMPSVATLMIVLGWKQDDWTSVATIGGYTELGEPFSTLGNDQGIVWDFLVVDPDRPITNPAGSFVVTGGAAAISRGAVIGLRTVQQFTLTRSVNGFTKAHAAGTEVHTHPGAVIAL
ncbi:hypothetical protein [Lentzea albida]|uniref:Uncharacterized protein n=1 Tax=Lentzea albida TaxID=65499 RepID=A0A1H9VGT0_9PSEU|nr:hypothetical protein [Lentzea albida]SES20852.1 hypothetical protein SAMN04488000_118109 [Lentzea albida]